MINYLSRKRPNGRNVEGQKELALEQLAILLSNFWVRTSKDVEAKISKCLRKRKKSFIEATKELYISRQREKKEKKLADL